MKFSYFISKRLSFGNYNGSSKLIVRIAIAAVALSVAVMIIAIAIVKGYQLEIRNKITGFSTHIQISHLDLNNSYETTPIGTDTIMERLVANVDGVKHVQKVAIKAGIIKTPDEFQGIVLKGVGKDYQWDFIQQYLQQGQILSYEDSTIGTGIVVSKKIADRLKLKIGDPVVMYFVQDPPRARKFTLTGIYDTGFDEMDALYAFVDIRHVRKLNNWFEGAISGYEIYIDDFNRLDEITQRITEYVPYHLEVRTIQQLHPELFDWLRLLDMNVVIIIVLMIIVACINMITALLILIVERSNMIGILKALGTSDMTVSRIFIFMAAYLIITGIIIGNIAGLAICFSQQYFGWFRLNQEVYYLSRVPIYLNMLDIAMINLGSFVVCYLMLVLPSRFVSRITPVKAIRFE